MASKFAPTLIPGTRSSALISEAKYSPLPFSKRNSGFSPKRSRARNRRSLRASQLAKVVDFSIEGQRETCLGIAHRLASACRIDDGKPPVPQEHIVAGAGAEEACSTLIVGPAMRDRMQHRLERVFSERILRPCDPSGNSAHVGLRVGRWGAVLEGGAL